MGISPKFIDDVVAKRALQDIKEDTILKWMMFE
jgi:sialic acid synthase SpsE